jgi:hypothetical protein
LGPIGIIGCLLSVIGAVVIIFHAPEDPEVQSVQELVTYMLKPGMTKQRKKKKLPASNR